MLGCKGLRKGRGYFIVLHTVNIKLATILPHYFETEMRFRDFKIDQFHDFVD